MKKGKKTFICIVCPLSCQLEIVIKGKKVKEVKGAKCRRGEKYAEEEFYTPGRILTTTVRVKEGKCALLPVRSTKPVPLKLLRKCVKTLSTIEVKAPVRMGEVVVRDILNTGVDIISTRDVPHDTS
ncbi:DUF1667 domain-containing protein [Candidatus Aerophobetes bacterium]|nr:DUF1667 domain-containing protein [Candidatus Aerophobetes bacterium]